MREIKGPSGSQWTIREILEPDRRKRHTQYFFQNRRAPRVLLTSKVAQQLAGYTLIEKDLRNVLVWLAEIDRVFPESERPSGCHISPDRERFNIIKGLYVAALTFYGKCFTQCEGRKIKLDRKFVDQSFADRHDDIIHMRNNFAAHSGADSFEDVQIALVLFPNKKSKERPLVMRELLQADMAYFGPAEEASFADLVKHVQQKVLLKIDELVERILQKEVLPKGKDYWYRLCKKG